MSNPKFKVENYQNLGGINSKFSPHLTSPLEFLDIKNYDFQTPGSLSQRWGSTQYFTQIFGSSATADFNLVSTIGVPAAGYNLSTFAGGQVFKATDSYQLASIDLVIRKSGNWFSGGNLSVQLYSASLGLPAGPLLATSYGFPISQMVTGSGGQVCRFNFPTNPQIIGNSSYAAVLTMPLSVSGTDTIFPKGESTGTYANGTALLYSGSTGGSFTASPTSDLYFQTYAQSASYKVTALSEYQKLDGSSTIIAGASGGLWYFGGSLAFQALTGMSLTTLGVTSAMSSSTASGVGAVNYISWSFGGVSAVNSYTNNTQGMFYKGSSQAYILPTGITNGVAAPWKEEFSPQILSGNYASIQYLVDYAFIASGSAFLKFNGATCNSVGLPIPAAMTLTYGYTSVPGSSIVGFGGTGIGIFYFSYVNDRGFESNIVPLVSCIGSANSTLLSLGTPVGLGAGYGTGVVAMTLTINTPLTFGISTINVYSFVTNDFLNHINYAPDTSAWSYAFTKLASFPASGSTFTHIPVGVTGGATAWAGLAKNSGVFPNPYSNRYQNFGITFGTDIVANALDNTATGGTDSKIKAYPWLSITNYFPQYLAVYDNRLFSAGYSSTPSTVWFSDVKEPEGYLPTNNFEVRTNDSDYITALSAYQTRLYIFKRNSFHVLGGDNPNNFFVQEISNQYGCLNNRSVVVFENLLYFLDRKGVVEYTGSNISFSSLKIQPIFDRMNYAAALITACGVHDKLRNQVLFAIPIDGATSNNLTVAYDYVAKAWTYHTGYNPSIFAEIQGRNDTKRVFSGNFDGTVNFYSASFLSDNGNGITLSFKTRYLHDLGDSVQKQFRRLYVNADNLGSTLLSKVNIMQDYGTSIVLGTTLIQGAFQERIDFGISAKSLAFEMITVNTTNSPLKIHGFTIESRVQRKV